jgi:hypothetical protein
MTFGFANFCFQEITSSFGFANEAPHSKLVLQKIPNFLSLVNVNCQDDTYTSSFPKGDVQEITMTFGFLAHTLQVKCPSLEVEVNDYHLIFDLNGVFVATSEGETKTHLVVLSLGFKEFLSACLKKIMVYIWSLAMKRNFSKHLVFAFRLLG